MTWHVILNIKDCNFVTSSIWNCHEATTQSIKSLLYSHDSDVHAFLFTFFKNFLKFSFNPSLVVYSPKNVEIYSFVATLKYFCGCFE